MKNKKDAGLRAEEKPKAVETEEDQPVKASEVPAPEENGEAELDAKEAEKTEKAKDGSITLSKAEFDEVHSHIEKLQSEKDETVAFCQRLQADFDNYRKRNATLHLDSVNEGERNVIKALLPVLDNFDRAMDNSESIDPAWMEGIKLVERQLTDTLTKLGLSEIEADGKFDPELHEAVMQQESEGSESGAILQVLQKGYKVKDRIIRHSMVSVAK